MLTFILLFTCLANSLLYGENPTNPRDLENDSSPYPLEKALPIGHVKDGSIDYSTYIQLAVDKHREITFPGYPLLINDKGIRIPSNSKIFFKKGSELRLVPSSKGSYSMLILRNVSNVWLMSPTIKGDRYMHKGTEGEWGMGIDIRGSTNVTIINASIYDCWGDGIYIDGYKNVVPQNIRLLNVFCKGNRRDGISIISADNLIIKDSYFGYTSGTAPMAGINFEPNNSSSELKNIKVVNVTTEKNGGYGIQIGLIKMYGAANKTISFQFENITDEGSVTGFKASSIPRGLRTVLGKIEIKNPSWRKNKLRALKILTTDRNIDIAVSKPEVVSYEGVSFRGNEAKSRLIKKGNVSSSAKFTIEN